ncbi:MAG: hypothetical protein GXY44_13625 [Phycisphaerales bacterium]|nr:hypothetical protein [Phycisphaerales bacterium]
MLKSQARLSRRVVLVGLLALAVGQWTQVTQAAEPVGMGQKLPNGFVHGDVVSHSYVPIRNWTPKDGIGVLPYLFEYSLMAWHGDKPFEEYHAENIRRIDIVSKWSTAIQLYNRYNYFHDELINLMIRCHKNRQLIIYSAVPNIKDPENNSFRNLIAILETLWANRDKVLAITRFCRDLYKKNPEVYSADYLFTDYVYGGTEEQLIDKPDILCETLGRLMVALCEICSIPGRVVMNEVKADVSDMWTREYRASKCETMCFNPREITGFQNYSLMDAGKYNYSQLTAKEVRDAGLFTINEKYSDACSKIFGLASDWEESHWVNRPLKKVPLVYRCDGAN